MKPSTKKPSTRNHPAFAWLLVGMLMLLAAFAFLPQPALADPGWYDAEWAYRKSITIAHGQVAGGSDLSNFPVLISLATDDELAAHAQGTGNDILFTYGETTKLSHEIEKFEGSDGELVAWVKVNPLSHGSDTVLYMYYGNADCESQQNPTGVWDSNYKGVWHLLGDGTIILPDATGSNAGTKLAIGKPTNTSSGKIDGAQVFDGTDDYVDLGKPANLNFAPNSDDFTLEAWIRTTDSGGTIVGKRGATGTDCAWQFYTNGGELGGIVGGTSGDTTHTVANGAWHHVVMVNYNDTGTQKFKFYVDGGPANDGGETSGSGTDDVNVMIGDSSVHAWPFHGTIDEVRISNNARTGDWIKTGYNSQSDPSSFSTRGSEVTNWKSYNDAARTVEVKDNHFTAGQNCVYMNGTGFDSGTHKVAYYDGGADHSGDTGAKFEVDAEAVGADGLLNKSQCEFPGANYGIWHAVVYKTTGTMPLTYNLVSSSDAGYVVEHEFEVDPEPCPEFPTVVAAIAVCMLCAVAYVVMRRKVGKGDG